MTDEQLLRYSRHILLEGIGIEGQRSLLASHVLIVGAGGLGCPAALYLASAGVATITLVDSDRVDISNLQRQIAHTQARVGMFKVHSLSQALLAINPEITVHALAEKADAALLAQCLPGVSLVLDCTDNFASRQVINRACVEHQTALVSGSALRFDGQVCVFDLRKTTSACYACLFPNLDAPQESSCAAMGVFAPLVGMVGSMQAAEGLKLLCGLPIPAQAVSSQLLQPALGRLLMIDSQKMAFESMAFAKNPACGVCRLKS